MIFLEFLILCDKYGLHSNATWRAYDIPNAVTSRHTKLALKLLGMGYAGELAMSAVVTAYRIDPAKAPLLLGSWWVLRQIEQGKRVRGLKLRPATQA